MKILLVEDDLALAKNLCELLINSGYVVDKTDLGRQAVTKAIVNEYDCILLDWMLPDINGDKVCREIREKGVKSPIIFLTAKDQLEDKLVGLDIGADDYITKPFAIEELLARIRVLVRRNYNEVLNTVIKIGDLSINTANSDVTIGADTVMLAPKTYSILEFLAVNKDKVVSREDIIEHIWDENEDLFSNVVDVHIKNIRKLYRDKTVNFEIKTVKGKGYVLCQK